MQEQSGSWTSPFRYAPSLSSVAPTNHAWVGGTAMSLHGTDFGARGTTVQARSRSTACERSLWIAETSIQCIVPAGRNAVGLNSVVATVAGVSGTLTNAMSYDVSAMRRTPGHELGKDSFAKSSASVSDSLTSFTFGQDQWSQLARQRGSIGESRFTVWPSIEQVTARAAKVYPPYVHAAGSASLKTPSRTQNTRSQKACWCDNLPNLARRWGSQHSG